ncbi:MAG: hypothetical protein RL721_168 [Candidatus Eisenbacteria bacterium]
MDGPTIVRFPDRLKAAEAEARARGELTQRDLDALVVDPDFDPEAFEELRQRLTVAGVRLPEEETPDPAAPIDRGSLEREAERDLLDRYLDEIGRFPLLPHEESLRVAAASRAGDERARELMIRSNLRLVVHVGRPYRNRGLPFLDVIEEGNVGLIHAVDRFEPERGLRFSTYASLWIRQAILRGIAEQSRAVRIPVQMYQQLNRYVRAERVVRARLGREPAISEVAEEMMVSPARAERLRALVTGMRSLDESGDGDGLREISHDDAGRAELSVERLVEIQLEQEKLDRLLRSLPPREEQLLRVRYGFHDGVARSLQETGEHFRISRERVRQIEGRALARLRRAIEMADLGRSDVPEDRSLSAPPTE